MTAADIFYMAATIALVLFLAIFGVAVFAIVKTLAVLRKTILDVRSLTSGARIAGQGLQLGLLSLFKNLISRR